MNIPLHRPMDVPRQRTSRRIPWKYVTYASVVLGVIVLLVLVVARLKPAAQNAERASLLIGTVKRGSMLREVRGNGTLVPQDIRIIAAATEGRVERVLVQPGTEVSASTVLLVLSNPAIEQEALNAEYETRAVEADYNTLHVKLESDRMSQKAVTAGVHSEYQQAKLQSDTDAALAKQGLVPALSLKLSQVKVDELANRYQIEQQRFEISAKSTQAQLTAHKARIEQVRALWQLKKARLASLQVPAGIAGVLQQLTIEVGQQVTPGTNLARVASQGNLRAQLKVAETQAKDIQFGQPVSIDTHNGIVPGRVIRIDPAVKEGTVTIDVALEGELPPGARPDLSVDGTIELERLTNVLYMGRPAGAQPQGTITLFKLESGGKSAVRVQVKLGRTSVDTVEIIEGLQEGDQVILSDVSQWDNSNRIVLN